MIMTTIYDGKKQATTGLKKPQGVGKHVEMITVNGWRAGGKGGECSVNEGDGEGLLSKPSPTVA